MLNEETYNRSLKVWPLQHPHHRMNKTWVFATCLHLQHSAGSSFAIFSLCQLSQAKLMGKPSRKVTSHLGKYPPPGLSFLLCNMLSFPSSLTHIRYSLFLAFGNYTHPWPHCNHMHTMASSPDFPEISLPHAYMHAPTSSLFPKPTSHCSSTPPTHTCPAPSLPTLLQDLCMSYLGLPPFPAQESIHLGLWLPRLPSSNDVVTRNIMLYDHIL